MTQKLNPLFESEFTSYTRDCMKTSQLKCKHYTYDAAKTAATP